MKNTLEERVGVLLVNLGTPDRADFCSVRRYLAEFLSDRRVVEYPCMIFWYLILYSMILMRRPQKSATAYARIWDYEKNESPLRYYTRSQVEKLQRIFDKEIKKSIKIEINWAMRYGQPSIETVTNAMLKRRCTSILLFPLYPHYSATTTASVYDVFFNVMRKQRVIPAIRTVSSYADDSVYITALAESIEECFSFKKNKCLIISYHGLPQAYVDKGDPYYTECVRTTKALRHKLCLNDKQLIMTFQSHFGKGLWLKPSTKEVVKKLALEGTHSIAIITPGFVSDCLETLDEIGNETARLFYAHGGKDFMLIPCLNSSTRGIRVLEHLIRKALSGLEM